MNYQYSITEADEVTLLEAQGGVCAACGTTDPGRQSWTVDHDHRCCPGDRSCGECIRGLVCDTCNKAMGMVKDDPSRLRRLADYLESWDHDSYPVVVIVG